jgi:sporulation protein YlmC with PRC-barrel domain
MLQVGSALKGYAIEASDGTIGTVHDLLFDDRSWKIRWLVIDTGTWLTGRRVLIHPSAIWKVEFRRRILQVKLTKAQVKASPDDSLDRPVSQRIETNLYTYYGWDPVWGSSYFGPGAMQPDVAGQLARRTDAMVDLDAGDPHLRSLSGVTGYRIQATDGVIGHLENILLEDEVWGIRYLIVDTRNWWPGRHVLMSPYSVKGISWPDGEIVLDVSRDTVKASPPWAPLDLIDKTYEARLHLHYAWPGYGW